MNKNSFKYRILFVPIILIFVLIVTVLCYSRIMLKNFVIDNNEDFLEETSSYQAKIFYSKIKDQLMLLQKLQERFEDVDFNDYNLLKKTICDINNIGEFNTISIVDENGTALCNNNTMLGNISKDNYFQKAMVGETVISDGLISDGIGGKSLSLYVPVMKDNKVCGVLLGTLDEKVLDTIFDIEIFGGKGYSYIINSDGKVIVASGRENSISEGDNVLDFLQNKAESGNESISKFARNIKIGEKGDLEYEVGNNSLYAAYQPVGIYNWYVVSVITHDIISYQTKRLEIIFYSLFLILFILIVAAFVLILFIKKGQRLTQLNNKEADQQGNIIQNNLIVENSKELDLLTHVYNNRSFGLIVQKIFDSSKSSVKAAFFIMSLTGFGEINRTIGHTGGDALLVKAANKLQRIFNDTDYIGRLGGDIFAVFMPVDESVTQKQLRELAKRKAEHLCSSFQNITYKSENESGNLSVSIGITISPDDGGNYVKMYTNADKALEYVKQNNKGSYKLFSELEEC